MFSVDWSNVRKDTFVSSSWDGNVKLVGMCLLKTVVVVRLMINSVETRPSKVHRNVESAQWMCLSGCFLPTSPRHFGHMLIRRNAEDLRPPGCCCGRFLLCAWTRTSRVVRNTNVTRCTDRAWFGNGDPIVGLEQISAVHVSEWRGRQNDQDLGLPDGEDAATWRSCCTRARARGWRGL